MLTPCPSCRRHVSARDEACPFCGALVAHVAQQPFPRASRAQMLVAAAAVALAGCENKSPPEVSNVATEKGAPSASASVVASAAPSPSAIPSLGNYDFSGHTGTGMAAAYGAPPPAVGAPKPPKGDVATSAATGDVAAVKDADKVIAVGRTRFRSCYLRVLNTDPSAEGKLTLILAIGADGGVTDAKVGSSTAPPLLGACVAGAARALKFSPPTKPATISVPLTFTSKS